MTKGAGWKGQGAELAQVKTHTLKSHGEPQSRTLYCSEASIVIGQLNRHFIATGRSRPRAIASLSMPIPPTGMLPFNPATCRGGPSHSIMPHLGSISVANTVEVIPSTARTSPVGKVDSSPTMLSQCGPKLARLRLRVVSGVRQCENWSLRRGHR